VARFLAARFTGESRHQRRLDKLIEVERRHLRTSE
jgi:ribose 5-phosphate isomerase RpiB